MAMKLPFTSFSMVFLATATVFLLASHHVAAQIKVVDPCGNSKNKDLCIQLTGGEKQPVLAVEKATQAVEIETDKLLAEVNKLAPLRAKEVDILLDILTDAKEKFTMIWKFRDDKKPWMYHSFHIAAAWDFERADEGYKKFGKPCPFLDKLLNLRKMAPVCTELAEVAYSATKSN